MAKKSQKSDDGLDMVMEDRVGWSMRSRPALVRLLSLNLRIC